MHDEDPKVSSFAPCRPPEVNMNIIGFPGQIRKFDNQIHFNFIQIRQILSCRENYHSYSFSYHSI